MPPFRVAVTTYPPGKSEHTTWLVMPTAPSVGDIIHAGDDSAAVEITRVFWVRDDDDLNGWHVECSAR